MKLLVKAVALTAVLAAPLAAFAQADQGLTREQVNQQLIEFQQTTHDQAAGRTQASAPANQGDSSFGGVNSMSSASGGRYVSEAARTGPQSVYFGGE